MPSLMIEQIGAKRRRDGDRLKSSITWKKPLDIDSSGDDPSEYRPNRKDPEAFTSVEINESKVGSRRSSSASKNDKKKKKKKKKKHSSDVSRRSERRESFGDRLKSSFNWRSHQTPIDISFENDDSAYDSPSIMTKPNSVNNSNHHLSNGYVQEGYSDNLRRKTSLTMSGVESIDG